MTAPAVRASDDVRARAAELRAAREPFVSATVVRAERPTSAKPGDLALVVADGTVFGFVGGECAEASVKAQALAVMTTGEAVLLRITPSPADDVAIPYGTVAVHNPCLSGGTLEIFLEPVLPPPLVVVHGDAPIARAMVGLATSLGYDVVPWSSGGLPGDTSAVVVASHGREEADVLTAALRGNVPYVGLVASRRRGAAVVAALDIPDDVRARLHTPAGLDIGARTPGEVALAILAEIVSVHPRPAVPGADAEAPPGPTAAADPVCGMTVAAVESSPHADHHRVRYWFCGSGCRQAFVDAPDAFVPA